MQTMRAISEGVITLILLVTAGLLIKASWREKLSDWLKIRPYRVFLVPLFLLFCQTYRFFDPSQRDWILYAALSCLFLLPVAIFFSYKERNWWDLLWVSGWLWIWSLVFVNVVGNHIYLLTITIYILIIFTHLKHLEMNCDWSFRKVNWRLVGAAICALTILVATGVAVGFFHWAPSRLLSKYQFTLPVAVIFFFLVKALPEELMFRGVLQSALAKKFGAPIAIAISAMIHGLSAVGRPDWNLPNWHALVTSAILGLLCGYVFYRNKSLLASMLLNSFVSFSLWLLFKEGNL